MASMLSREELDALLGKGDKKTSGLSPSERYRDQLMQAVAAAAQAALASFSASGVEITGCYESTWGSFPARAGASSGDRLILSECRLTREHGSFFVVTTSLGAIRADEVARRAFGIEQPETLVGFSLFAEHLVKHVYRGLALNHQNTNPSMQCLPPKHWVKSGCLTEDARVWVVEMSSHTIATEPLYFLVPRLLLERLVGVSELRGHFNEEAPAMSNSGWERIADIPISVELCIGEIRQPIRNVAAWELGTQVTLDITPGQTVTLQANGRVLGRGEVMATATGGVTIKLTKVI